MNPKALLPVVTLLLCHGTSGAATLVADNFTSSTGTNATSVSNTQATGTGAYGRVYTGTSSTYTVGPVSGFGSGNVLTLGDGDSTHARTLNSSTVFSLASLSTGSVLSLSFDIRFSGTFAASGTRQFSFGFINRTPATQSSIAYGMVGQDTGSFRLRSSSFNMSTSGTEGGAQIGTSGFNTGLVTDTNYNLKLAITKTGDTSYLLQYFQNGSEIASTTSDLASTAGLDINAIGLRWSSAPGVTTHLDNVTVELIPEPSAAALMAAGLLVGCGYRRRRR